MKNLKPTFSLIIPCFNESKNLPTLIERCNQNHLKNIEIILVNNGSTDDSETILESLLMGISHIKKVKVEKNQGYGYGIIVGLREAKNEIIGWTHADLQTEPSDIINAIPLFDDNQYDRIFVKGLRKGRPLSDLFFTLGMSIFESIYLRYFFWDINAQPTLFHRDFLKEFKEPPLDFSLDLYVYFLAKKNKFNIKRFPVFFLDRLYGISHWNIDFKSKLKLIFRTVKFSSKLRKNYK